MIEYAIYDMKEYEQFVYSGTIKQVANYLECSPQTIRSYMSYKKNQRDGYIHKRYEIIKVEEEDIEEKPIKTNYEIFQELINAFMPEKHNFLEFDSFNHELKHRMNMVIINEEWKPIKEFNYSVSNYGRVKNNTTGKLKELRVGRFGYQINLWDKSKSKMFTMSRLVAHYFIREVQSNERVMHIDGDIRNNYYKNLKIVGK